MEAAYWLLIFLSPMLAFGLVAFFIYLSNHNAIYISGVIAFMGIPTGIALAEHARKKYGCSNYYSRIFSSPDLDEVAKRKSEEKR